MFKMVKIVKPLAAILPVEKLNGDLTGILSKLRYYCHPKLLKIKLCCIFEIHRDFMKILSVILLLGAWTLMIRCQEKKYHDVAGTAGSVEISDPVREVIEFQKKLNSEFRDPATSPLPDRFRKDFSGLEFFVPDTNFRVVATLVRTPDALPFLMPTSTDRKSEEVVYGIAQFTLNGKKQQLEVYQNRELMQQDDYVDYLFLPFLDPTNGEETYGGGRYIDLRVPEGDILIIDFNKAYNPYCAYNKKYSCPLVPRVNELKIPIKAGVKAFSK